MAGVIQEKKNWVQLASTCVHHWFNDGVCVARLLFFCFPSCVLCPMLPLTLDRPLLIASSVFSNVFTHSHVYWWFFV
jgi:hypothetical protein